MHDSYLVPHSTGDAGRGSKFVPPTALLISGTTSVCYEGIYDAPDIIKNEAEKFKAKAQ